MFLERNIIMIKNNFVFMIYRTMIVCLFAVCSSVNIAFSKCPKVTNEIEEQLESNNWEEREKGFYNLVEWHNEGFGTYPVINDKNCETIVIKLASKEADIYNTWMNNYGEYYCVTDRENPIWDKYKTINEVLGAGYSQYFALIITALKGINNPDVVKPLVKYGCAGCIENLDKYGKISTEAILTIVEKYYGKKNCLFEGQEHTYILDNLTDEAIKYKGSDLYKRIKIFYRISLKSDNSLTRKFTVKAISEIDDKDLTDLVLNMEKEEKDVEVLNEIKKFKKRIKEKKQQKEKKSK